MTKMRRTLYTLGLCALLMLGMGVFAQDEAEPITIGDTVEGTLGEGEQMDYLFDAAEGDVLLISLESVDFDTYLYLLDSEGDEITNNDDGGEGTNSLITFQVEQAGEYIVRATSFGQTGSGLFTLSLQPFEAGEITYGDAVENDGGQPTALYAFEGVEGDLIVASLSAEGLDTSITLVDSEGNNLVNSTYFDGQNARLGPFALPNDGLYALSIRAEGASRLLLDTVEPVELTLGESTPAELTAETQVLYFAFNLEEPLLVDVVVDSGGELDTRFELLNPFGFLETAEDNNALTVDPQSLELALDNTGVYYLIVAPSDLSETLEGELNVTIVETQVDSLDEGSQTLVFDSFHSERVVNFEGSAGERVQLTIEVDVPASPFLEVTQAGVLIASYGQDRVDRAVLTFTVPEDGPVTITAQTFTEANLTLTLERESES
ncbi:MAG: hypothetical protein OHK0046_12240 [Anaerolineae bacterium]